jgi:hypothetical protein
MHPVEPLPFRIQVEGEDVIDFGGIRSVSYRVEGLLHLVADALKFEWSAIERTERVSLSRIGTDVDHSPIGTLEVQAGWIAEVRLHGGWWWPRMAFRARRLDAFQGMPGARPGAITLKIRRRYRKQAKALVAAIEHARVTAPLPLPESLTELEGDDTSRLGDGGSDP